MKKSNLMLKNDGSLIEYSPTEELLDIDFMSKAIAECWKNKDIDGVMEVIETYLEAVYKTKL